eukprot:CAMPEP_0172713706 /NCGR_PEP_ID=MMETSP1074-20121228/63457_1 /TAXON_ID=2916 /ORGANISM="Ceratium fusus, Strain PA161109" /LENGTH=81 /DNA_ID=CAMNT_0013537893 /DNA_START=183 /DNA_END=428 /DNA_ORIENTATION=+
MAASNPDAVQIRSEDGSSRRVPTWSTLIPSFPSSKSNNGSSSKLATTGTTAVWELQQLSQQPPPLCNSVQPPALAKEQLHV